MSKPITFITLEGPEGAGKTTQSALLAQWLRARGEDVLVTRQPGGDNVGKRLREILLAPGDDRITPRAELLMMMADRAQSVTNIIKPHLDRGGTVICDRYGDSSMAYQGYGRGLDRELVQTLNDFAVDSLWPDLTLLFDIDPAAGLARQSNRTRMEEEAIEFHQKVHAGFLEIARQNPARVVVIDAAGTIDEIAERVQSAYETHHRNYSATR